MFNLTGHLIYWGGAIVIYPLCESNIYVISPDAPTFSNSPLTEKFSEHFSGESLLQVSTFKINNCPVKVKSLLQKTDLLHQEGKLMSCIPPLLFNYKTSQPGLSSYLANCQWSPRIGTPEQIQNEFLTEVSLFEFTAMPLLVLSVELQHNK